VLPFPYARQWLFWCRCNDCLVRGLSTAAVMSCPVCKYALSRTSFFQHSQHYKLLEMESAVRKVVLSDLMKTGDLFSTLKDYNRYLEDVETLVYKIPNDVDTKETMKQYGRFKRKSTSRLEMTDDEGRRRRELYLNDEAQKLERTQREGMLESLARGTISSATFLENAHTLAKSEEPSLVATDPGAPAVPSGAAGTMPPPAAAAYTYRPQTAPAGMSLPRPMATPSSAVGRSLAPGQTQAPVGGGVIMRDVVPTYLTPEQEARSAAGGYRFELVRKRALEEALDGLWAYS
jgi:hypothetical protein